MQSWQALVEQLRQFINAFVRLVKARRREESAIGIAAFLFWLGYYFISFVGRVSVDLQKFVVYWHGDLIVPISLYALGAIFLGYAVYRIWRLAFASDLPPVSNRPSAIKGPGAFTPADGKLFRKLGREDDLRKLLGYIEDDQVCMIVLMGASGAGKTSLIRAGLTDILKETANKEDGVKTGEQKLDGRPIKFHYWEAVSTDSGRGLLRAIQESWLADSRLDSKDKTDGIEQSAPSVEPKSLEELINPPPSLGDERHVIVMDQFEQLHGNANGPVFKLLRRVAARAKPPHRITWLVVFRREFRADWSDFIIPEQERGFFPPELSLRLFTPDQSREIIAQLIQAAGLSVEQKVVDNLIEAATVDGEISSVDIGIGLLVLSEMYDRQAGKTVTEEAYHFAGGAEGVLTQYIDRCLDYYSDQDRGIILNAMLALRDPETNQRIAEGKTCEELAEETKAEARRLRAQLERLTQRDMRLLEHAPAGEDEATRYRLPHERLISSLNRLAGKVLGESVEAKLKFSNAFSAWKKNHASQYLLKGKDLRLVERNTGQILWGKDEQDKQQFLRSSQRRRILKRLMSVALIFLLVSSGWLANSQYQRYEVRRYLLENNYPPELADWQNQLKSLSLREPFNLKYFPWLRSNTLEELAIKATRSTNSLEGLGGSLTRCSALKKLALDISGSQVNSLEPLARLTSLNQLTLFLNESAMSGLEPLAKLTGLDRQTFNTDRSQVSSVEPLAKLTGLNQVTLDLSDSDVNSLEPLGNLTSLNQLTLNLSGSKVSSLEPLAKLSNLNQLTLGLGASSVSSLEPLAKLTNLNRLTLYLSTGSNNGQVSNLEALAKLTRLNQLTIDLSRSKVTSLESVAQLSGLDQLELDLSFSEVSSLAPIAKLTGLNQLTLNLFISKIRGLEPVSKLTGLNQLALELDKSERENCKSIVKVTSLKQLTLHLSDSQASDWEPVAKLVGLNQLTLDISFSNVSNLEPLAELTALNQLTLDISRSHVSDLSSLAKLTDLNQLTLNLVLNPVSNLEPLAKLTGLNQLTLELGNNPVTSLEPLGKLANLDQLTLDLELSKASSLEPLAKLSKLNQLTLVFTYCPVSSLEPLAKLINLSHLTLNLTNSPVSSLEPVITLSCQTLDLTLTTEQRLSLRSIPKSVTELSF